MSYPGFFVRAPLRAALMFVALLAEPAARANTDLDVEPHDFVRWTLEIGR